MNKEKVLEALDNAISALHIEAGKNCSEKLTPTLLKKCKERKNRFKEAIEILKDFKLSYSN